MGSLNASKMLQCLSNPNRGISFHGSSLLGIRNLRGRPPLLHDGIIVCYDSSTVLVTSDISFLQSYVTIFANRKERKRNRPFTRLFFPSACEKWSGNETTGRGPIISPKMKPCVHMYMHKNLLWRSSIPVLSNQNELVHYAVP